VTAPALKLEINLQPPRRPRADLDRFDRLLLATPSAPRAPAPPPRPAPVARAEVREPVITSKRGPRFVDRTRCPMCGTDELGIEYHGELRDGSKVHQIAAHTAGLRRVDTKQPRCLGAGLRVVFDEGGWRGVVTP
jgi:hypothetical protein